MSSVCIPDTFLATFHTTLRSVAVVMQFAMFQYGSVQKKMQHVLLFFLHQKLTGTDYTGVNQGHWNTWKTLCMHF
ncbi:unnamed protein product [Staurois parvus]|uniref:Uncharacterized protein n=1 Tax=Staurois parvus TaxID=386267 RepID=A0ABN9CHN1_9NEOB|nr:unnamed protein product [Staurois parvus]